MFYVVSGLVFALLVPPLAHAATLENPGNGSFYSGIGVVSGWKCSANGRLTVRFNGGNAIPLAYRNERSDTRGSCGDTDNGFVAIWNYGNLGDGTHTAVVYDNGREFARSTFTVTTLGEAFVRGASGECTISNFPESGETTTFEWNQNTQNLLATEWEGGRNGGGNGGDEECRGFWCHVPEAQAATSDGCVTIEWGCDSWSDNIMCFRNNCSTPVNVRHHCTKNSSEKDWDSRHEATTSNTGLTFNYGIGYSDYLEPGEVAFVFDQWNQRASGRDCGDVWYFACYNTEGQHLGPEPYRVHRTENKWICVE